MLMLYTSQTLDMLFYFRVIPMYIPAVWKIAILTRVQTFLWLLFTTSECLILKRSGTKKTLNYWFSYEK